VKVEITEVERLALQPGDRLIVHVDQHLTDQLADWIEQIVRSRLQLPADVPVLVTGLGMSVAVVTP
jgi:hypothetical protein